MAKEGTQTTGSEATAQPTPQAAPAEGRDAWDKMGVSLDDLPLIQGGDKQEANEPKVTDGTTTENDGEPAKTEATAPAGSELKTKAGRVFKDPTELLTAYENSSEEGIRLHNEMKSMKLAQDALNTQLQEANKALVELQEYVSTSGTFPGAKSPEEVAAMTEEERYNYYSSKREWDGKRKAYTDRITNAKKEAEEYAQSVKASIARTEQEMASDSERYPGFTDMAPLRTEILKNSPHLDGRTDTPYVTYFIAKGIMADREKAEAKRLEKESTDQAKAKADAAARQAGGGAPPTGDKPAPKEKTGMESVVGAFKARRSGF